LEKVPWATEKNVYCLAVGWNTLSTISIWANVCSSNKISLFIFSLDHLSIHDSGVLRSLTVNVLVSMCALRAITAFVYVGGCPCIWCI
jgi:predicted neutral ceramidase superfamily lipid hydrolase